jgi:hypothetical protein
VLTYISDATITLPRIHDTLDQCLGHARYEREGSIWSKILDALHDPDMDAERLQMAFNAERQKYFVSAVCPQCKHTPNPVLLGILLRCFWCCIGRINRYGTLGHQSSLYHLSCFYLVLKLCLYAESRVPEGLYTIQKLPSPAFDLDVSFFNPAI